MTKYNNSFQIDYTCPGFCSYCFAEIAEFDGSFQISPTIHRPKIKLKKEDDVWKALLKSNFRSRLVNLSDGSQMTISLCDHCENLTPQMLPKLMANEAKGWQKSASDFKISADYKSNLSITDVPEMMWDEATKKSLENRTK